MVQKLLFYCSIIVIGAVVMIYELVGSRIMAPQFGNTIYVWTNIIGVILASLSFGYFFGGKIADNKPSKIKLSYIILIAAILVLSTMILKEGVLAFTSKHMEVLAGSFIASVILFAPASFVMGMVSPYATRLSLTNIDASGQTVGRISAISTTGSIIGTFMAGFILIPLLGSTKILYLLVALLLFAAFMISPKSYKYSIAIVIALAFSILIKQNNASGKIVLDIDTSYSRIIVEDTNDFYTNKAMRTLSQDRFGIQSAMLKDSDDLALEYTKYFRLSELINPNLNSALIIGGAAYSYPKDFIKRNKGTITVVEIDPKTTEIAKKYFRLQDNKNIQIVHQDGRVFINNTKQTFDTILIDAFSSLSPPFQLATNEAVVNEAKLLTKNGSLIVNIVGTLSGPYFRSQYTAYKNNFNNVYVFPLDTTQQNERQNIILVATNGTLPDDSQNAYTDLLAKRYNNPIANFKPFTDDYAPVEFFTSI